MPQEIIMPALGMAQTTGVLLAWLKKEGDSVQAGEPIMEIETDKASVEIESPSAGILANFMATEGEEIPVGQVMAYILAPGEQVPQPAAVQSAPAVDATGKRAISPVAARLAAEFAVDINQVKAQGSKISRADVEAYLRHDGQPAALRSPASPKARRLASENGIDLSLIKGSGTEGAVLAADVLAFQPPAAQLAAAPIPVSRMWRVMADRLAESWRSVPHFYLEREVDATRLGAWREAALTQSAEKITYTDLLVKVIAHALAKHPRLNAFWQAGEIYPNADINIGLAVAVEEGLLVPVIHHADRLGLEAIASRRRELVERATTGKVKPDDLAGGTFTLSNLGMYGVDKFSAIINPPQAAILAVGRIADRLVPVKGEIMIRPMLHLTLSCDHRVVDGARGAEFLSTLAALLEEPLGLIQ